jgi:hypothetical protein
MTFNVMSSTARTMQATISARISGAQQTLQAGDKITAQGNSTDSVEISQEARQLSSAANSQITSDSAMAQQVRTDRFMADPSYSGSTLVGQLNQSLYLPAMYQW